MPQPKQSPALLISLCFEIFKQHPYPLITLVALSRLFKFLLLFLITAPLLKVYASQGSLEGMVHFFESLGINPKSPAVYGVLAVVLFIAYVFSSLLYSSAMGSLSAYFRGERFSLKTGLKQVSFQLGSLLLWCLINKTIGILVRLWDAFTKTIFVRTPMTDAYGWQVNTCFVFNLILDQACGPLRAWKKSQELIQKNWGRRARFSLQFSPIALLSLMLGAIPLLVGLLIHSSTALLVGMGLSIILWYLFSMLSSILYLILSTALYEYLVEEKLPKGFTPELLKSVMVSV